MKTAAMKMMTTSQVLCGLLAGAMSMAYGADAPGAAAGANIPELPELNWEKRSDWLNVRTGMEGIGPAAVGDGVADDTAALQAAFDHIVRPDSSFSTVYIPPGTYRITRTINPRRVDKGATSMHIRGHGRSTRIVWDGPEGGTMLHIYSFGLSTYIGTVWDGRGKAAQGFMHDGGNETKVKHEHQAFVNCTEQGSGATEERLSNINKQGTWYIESSEWRNCLFINNGKGLAFWHYNDYIFTIDGCEFHDNGYGIWTRRGNSYVRNSHFQRSTQADIANPSALHGCSVRRCTSVGSRAFLHDSGFEMTVQDCHVSGWTNPDGAVICGGSPMLIFDCVFTNAPSANPPIRLNSSKSVVHSNNRTSTSALFGGRTDHVVEVPKGQRGGSITSAQQRFFKSDVAIPAKVFDAKRDFGARGDGQGDDSDAVQRTIDAARQHARGAIAYFPRGTYRVSKTINITGRDYYVGGAGACSTIISWGGDDRGPIILVSDPQNVTMECLQINNRNLLTLIRQVSTVQQPSRMHYEHVRMHSGGGNPNPHTFTGPGAFEAVGLSKDSVLTAYCFYTYGGGLSFDNCSSPRILLNHVGSHSYGVLRVRGTQSDRSGFFRVQTGHTRYRIEDNQSFVGSDCYAEGMGADERRSGPFIHLMGSPTLPAGRVTLSGPKWGGADRYSGAPYEEYITVDNYHGRLSSVITEYYNPTETYEPNKKAFKIVCTGAAPLDTVLMANAYGQGGKSSPNVPPVVEGGSNVTRTLLGNWFNFLKPRAEPVPNVVQPNGLRLASQALDDFRELGALDLELNHAEK